VGVADRHSRPDERKPLSLQGSKALSAGWVVSCGSSTQSMLLSIWTMVSWTSRFC